MPEPHNDPTLYAPTADSAAAGEPEATLAACVDAGALPTESASTPAAVELPAVPGYDLLAEIGRGGMGVVYKARHLALNRDVALKMILAGSRAGPVEMVRFRQEAEAIAGLDHPNIVRVHEVGAHQGQSYLALEYVGGGDLAGRTAGVPQPFAGAARMVETLSAAVQHAHACGILHRDLKPANILLTPDGVPRIADFGLARRIGDAEGITATHAVLGTPGYISPEQATGSRGLGPTTDVYGLGGILYALLVGRPPFQGENAVETLLRVVADPPVSVRRLRPDCPRDLEVICLKCLQKDPAKRYPSAAALGDDLRHYLANEPIRARPVGRFERVRRWARRHPGVAALLGLTGLLLGVIAVGGVGLSLRLNAALGESERNRVLALGDRDAARKAEAEGREKLYQSLVSEARAGRFSRRVGQRFGTLDAVGQAVALARELKKPEAAIDDLRNLAVAALALPDLRHSGEWIADPAEAGWLGSYRSVDPLFRYDAATDARGAVSLRHVGTGPGDATEIARLPGFGREAYPEWSPDGRYLAVMHGHSLRLQVWKADDRAPTLVLEEEGCLGFGFGPDGRGLIALRRAELRFYDLATGKPGRSLPLSADRIGGPVVGIAQRPGPPGRFQAAALVHSGVVLLDLTTGERLDTLPTARNPSRLAWHPDGELLAVSTPVAVEVWDVARKRLDWKLEHRGGGLFASFAPEGDLLATCGWTSRVRLWNPYTGREAFRTTGQLHQFGPGGRLATTLSEDWKGGKGPLTRLEAGREYRTIVAGAGRTPAVQDYRSCSVHPGGRLLAVGTLQGIGLADLATGGERAFLPVTGASVLFEPSGSLLTNVPSGLYRWPVRADADSPGRWVVGPPERVGVAVLPELANLACGDTGAVLAASVPHQTGAWVWKRDRPAEAVLVGPHPDCRYVAVSPDGRLVATGSHSGLGLKVWDAAGGGLVRTLLPETQGTLPAFSADGRWLTNHGGQTWRVADWSEGPRHVGIGGGVVVGGCAFSPDGRLAAWGGHKGFVPLVDPDTGRELVRLEDPNLDALGSLTFGPDGTQLIGTTIDGFCVRVWDLRKIRVGLKGLGLDWDALPYPPESGGARPQPLRVELVGAGELLAPANPPAPNYQALLGAMQYRAGRYADAAAALEKSLAGGGGRSDGFDLYYLAMCRAKLGDGARAADCFKRAGLWSAVRKDLSPKRAAELQELRTEAEGAIRSAQPKGK